MKKLVWPGLPIALIASIVVLDVVMIVVATMSPPVVVEGVEVGVDAGVGVDADTHADADAGAGVP